MKKMLLVMLLLCNNISCDEKKKEDATENVLDESLFIEKANEDLEAQNVDLENSVVAEYAGKFLMRHPGLITFYVKCAANKYEAYGDEEVGAFKNTTIWVKTLADLAQESGEEIASNVFSIYEKQKGLQIKSLKQDPGLLDRVKLYGATLKEVFSLESIKGHWDRNKYVYTDIILPPAAMIALYKGIQHFAMKNKLEQMTEEDTANINLGALNTVTETLQVKAAEAIEEVSNISGEVVESANFSVKDVG